jgi:hypothetical protein
LQGDPLRFGARCPRCREPLYERPDGARRQREAQEASGGACAVHPNNIALGACKRCGTFMCGLCRSRWDDRVLCLACVERLVSGAESASQEGAAHRGQASAAIILGMIGWLLTLPVFIVRGAGTRKEVLVACLLTAIFSYLPTVFGLGMAASAVRVRGDRMVAATCGLLLNGAQLGTVTGLVLLLVWQQ